MLTRILIPIDCSELSESILEQVQRLLTRKDAEVILLHVLPQIDDELPRQGLSTNRAVHEYLEVLEAKLTEAGVQARHLLRTGDPAEEILGAADELEPSLIAMTTHGWGGLNLWVRGSVAERVLRRSAHPLLLCSPSVPAVQEGDEDRGFRRILVPLDGSDFSTKVLPLVEIIARTYDAQVTLYRAIAPVPTTDPQTLTKPAESGLRAARESLESAGVPVRMRVDLGPAAAGIFGAVEAEGADLVAMATHGRSGISRWAFGSVAGKVLRHCPVPLLAVRPSQRSRNPDGA